MQYPFKINPFVRFSQVLFFSLVIWSFFNQEMSFIQMQIKRSFFFFLVLTRKKGWVNNWGSMIALCSFQLVFRLIIKVFLSHILSLWTKTKLKILKRIQVSLLQKLLYNTFSSVHVKNKEDSGLWSIIIF